MFKRQDISRLKLNPQDLFFILVIIVLLSINLGFSWVVRYFEFFYVPNTMPLGFQVGIYTVFLVLLFVTWGIKSFGYIDHYPIPSILILAGSWSNLLERIIVGNVADYITFIWSYINLADIQIWIGLILLNYFIWLSPLKLSKNTQVL